MLEIKKTVSIDINIDQEGIEKLIRDEIARTDPQIQVREIKLIAQRKPIPQIVAEVDAFVAGYENAVKIKTVADEPEENAIEEPDMSDDDIEEALDNEHLKERDLMQEAIDETEEEEEVAEEPVEESKPKLGSLFNR